jgi:hypothetical protein
MKGAETFAQSEQVQKLVSGQYGEGRLLGMICAGENIIDYRSLFLNISSSAFGCDLK